MTRFALHICACGLIVSPACAEIHITKTPSNAFVIVDHTTGTAGEIYTVRNFEDSTPVIVELRGDANDVIESISI